MDIEIIKQGGYVSVKRSFAEWKRMHPKVKIIDLQYGCDFWIGEYIVVKYDKDSGDGKETYSDKN